MTRTSHPRAVTVRLLATQSLEDYAAKALAPETVFAAITKAAAEGFYICCIKSEQPVNLTDTKAAKALAVRLTEEGFAHEWKPRMVLGRENASAADICTFDLLVNW